MTEVRVSFSAGMYAIMEDDKAIMSDYKDKSTLVNIANIAADMGKITDTTEDEEGILAIRIEVPDSKRNRLIKEVGVLSSGKRRLGRIGYVLGLHSSVYVSTNNNKKLETPLGYSAVVQGTSVYNGIYMYVTLSKSIVDSMQGPRFFEDYIYLRQLERAGVIKNTPDKIPVESFSELLKSLTEGLKVPWMLYSSRVKNMSIRRYAGIAVGMMVKYGYINSIPGLMAVATDMSLDKTIDPEIFGCLVDAVKLANRWGDI